MFAKRGCRRLLEVRDGKMTLDTNFVPMSLQKRDKALMEIALRSEKFNSKQSAQINGVNEFESCVLE